MAKKKLATVFHFDLFGKRKDKYEFLNNNSINSIQWNELENKEPYFFFVKKNFKAEKTYNKGFKINDFFIKGSSGIKSHRDNLVYDICKNNLLKRISTFINSQINDIDISKQLKVKGNRDWNLKEKRQLLKNSKNELESFIRKVEYKPFNKQYCFYHIDAIDYHRKDLLVNMFDDNILLMTSRKSDSFFKNIFLTKELGDIHSVSDQTYCYPLYLYPIEKGEIFKEEKRKPNLNQEIVNEIAEKLGLEFVSEKNSPPLEGCLKGGVVLTTINDIPIYRNFVENLPYNPKLKQLARDKRKAGILSEVLFWQQVHKSKFHKIDFDRQRIVGNFIVDFYVKTLGLIIEIDGNSHKEKKEYDTARQKYLENLGLTVYRIDDLDVKQNIEKVMFDLENFIVNKYGKNTTPSYGHPSKGGEFSPIDILDYIYAVLHSPTYREKYKEFLKIDFPRVPYPKDEKTFWSLVTLGGDLRQIHLLESKKVENYITSYPKDGDNVITTKITKKDWELFDTEKQLGRIWINDKQYFNNIPLTAWEFYIGGYQPAQKWLKDRKERELKFEDIMHYQKIIVALSETDRIMKEIDKIEIEKK